MDNPNTASLGLPPRPGGARVIPNFGAAAAWRISGKRPQPRGGGITFVEGLLGSPGGHQVSRISPNDSPPPIGPKYHYLPPWGLTRVWRSIRKAPTVGAFWPTWPHRTGPQLGAFGVQAPSPAWATGVPNAKAGSALHAPRLGLLAMLTLLERCDRKVVNLGYGPPIAVGEAIVVILVVGNQPYPYSIPPVLRY